jgi:hypothetical protein
MMHSFAVRPSKKMQARQQLANTNRWINSQILAKANSGCKLSELISMVTTHLPQMNLVNLTTAIHRLAKIAAHDPEAQAVLTHDSTFLALCDSLGQHLGSVTCKDVQLQVLSNIAWALATARHSDTQVLSMVMDLAIPNVARFKYFELSTFLWAIAKSGTIDPLVFKDLPVKELFDAVADHLVLVKSVLNFRCLSMIVWAAATAKQSQFKLLAYAASCMESQVEEAGCQEMANVTWAFGTLGLEHTDLCEAIAHKAMKELRNFKPQELSNMFWGFASSSFYHAEFFRRAIHIAARQNLQPQHVANILWAFTRVCPDDELTRSTVLNFLPLCSEHLDAFKPRELSSIALSVAKAFESFHSAGNPPHAEVIDFYLRVALALPDQMDSFGSQSFAGLIRAFLVMDAGNDELVATFGQEALKRMPEMPSLDVIRVFEAFLQPASCSDIGASFLAMFAAELHKRVDGFKKHEIRSLTRVFSSVFTLNKSATVTRPDLKTYCRWIGSNQACFKNSAKFPMVCTSAKVPIDAVSTVSTDTATSVVDDVDTSDGNSDATPEAEGQRGRSSTWQEVSIVRNTFLHFVGEACMQPKIASMQRSSSSPSLCIQ